MSAPEADLLGRLFRCERFVGLFPTGMPMRACLRRQLDRLVTLDGKGQQRPARDWPAAKPFCAGECSLGRQHLEEARAAGVPAETCLRCGSAQVGSGSAAPCVGCEPDAKEVPHGHLPPAARLRSDRIWTGEVPDPPIAPPSAGQTASLPAMRRLADERRQNYELHERQAASRRASVEEQDHQEEDGTMAKDVEKHCSKCGKKLRSDNTRGVCGSRCKEPAGSQESGVKAAKVTPLRPPAPRRAEASRTPSLSTQELLQQRAAIDEELRRRLAVAQDELIALKAAVGDG
jgi:hypothetical protein